MLQMQWQAMQETLMHLQHDQQKMHEVLLAQQEEIGRLTGEADWSSENAKAILQALINQSPKS